MKTTPLVMLVLVALLAVSCEDDTDSGDAFPTAGLVSYFKFNDNLKDEQNNTPEGVNSGGATFVAGKSGKAIKFNGVDQKVVFDRKSFKSSNAVSVAFWIKSPHTVGAQFFMSCSDFLIANQSIYSFAISVPSTSSATGAYTSDTWTHFAGTYDGTDIKVYINGVIAETTNHPGTIFNLNENLTIGYRDGSGHWSGSVDEFFLYGKALTQAEVTQIYNLHK